MAIVKRATNVTTSANVVIVRTTASVVDVGAIIAIAAIGAVSPSAITTSRAVATRSLLWKLLVRRRANRVRQVEAMAAHSRRKAIT